MTTKNVMKQFFSNFQKAINAIEILKNRVLPFVLTRHFTTPKRGKEKFQFFVATLYLLTVFIYDFI